MIIRMFLTASLSVMVLAAACGGGEGQESTVNLPPTSGRTPTAQSTTVTDMPNQAVAAARLESGVELHQQGLLAEAIAEYDQAIRLNPLLAPAYLNRGVAYRKSGELHRAIEDYDEAIRLDPQLALAYSNRD